MQQPPDAGLIVLNTELPRNELGNPRQRPQLGGPAMLARALLQIFQ
jgi:hypothetical protein